MLQTPDPQIQSRSFKSEEARPSPHGSEAKGKGCVIKIVLKVETIYFIILIYCNNAICASNMTLLVHKALLE